MRVSLLLSIILSFRVSYGATFSGKISIKNQAKEEVTDTCSEAIVFLEPIEEKINKFEATKREEIVSINRQLKPSVLPILKGTTVQFPNQDTVLHNVFSVSKTKKFDLGLYRKGTGKSIKFDESGLIKVFCNIHPGMSSVILILDYPYFARTDKKCSFNINDIPKGKYKANAWYRYGKGFSKEVSIINSSNVNNNFEVLETKKRKHMHKNKHGKSYKESY